MAKSDIPKDIFKQVMEELFEQETGEYERSLRNVIWFYDRGDKRGWESGGFIYALQVAMDKADGENLQRLLASFTTLTTLMATAKCDPQGLNKVKALLDKLDKKRSDKIASADA